MNPNLVAAVRKRRGLDHQGLPLESTSPYGGLSEADLNATGPLEGPEQPPPELPTPAPHEVAAAQQALDETEAVQPRPGSVPAQVGQAVMAAAPVDNDAEEMAAAQEADRNARNNGRIELAAKQFVSGVTQTPQAGVSQAGPAQVPQAQARAKSRREQVADELMRRRQGVMDASTLDLQKSQAEKNRRDPGPKGGVDYTASRDAKLALDREKLDEQKRAALVREELARQKMKRGAKPSPSAESAFIPFAGGELKPKAGRTINPQIAKETVRDVGLYNAAVGAIDTMKESLSAFAKNPSPATRDAVLAQVNGTAGALNVAQGQGAMSEGELKNMMGALGVDIMTPGGVEALVRSLTGGDPRAAAEAITRRVGAVRQLTINAAKARFESAGYEYATGGAKGGRVVVSNGKESLEIDADKLKEAEADGYKAVR